MTFNFNSAVGPALVSDATVGGKAETRFRPPVFAAYMARSARSMKMISAFEARHFRRTNCLALAFFALHVPVLMGVAWMNGTCP